MKVLVIGSGGREHALAWKVAQSPRVTLVLVAPGNGGTARDAGGAHAPIRNLAVADAAGLADFAAANDIALTVVGPEAPLAAGIVDVFRGRGLRIFGPTQAAAQLESSKDFAKRFVQRHGIPTAAHQTFGDAAAAHEYVERHGAPIVIKADGLAAGKGVVVAQTLGEAHAAIDASSSRSKAGSVWRPSPVTPAHAGIRRNAFSKAPPMAPVAPARLGWNGRPTSHAGTAPTSRRPCRTTPGASPINTASPAKRAKSTCSPSVATASPAAPTRAPTSATGEIGQL